MDRNVYSLVLIDDVVEAVDRMAYEKNTSRSNLINQILAEYLSCPTPEMRMKDIFEGVEEMMKELRYFQMQFQPSDSMISIRSALKYRYKPTIRYVLELYRDCTAAIGELRVSMRTQSQPLIEILTEFFEFWAEMENRCIGGCFPDDRVPCRLEPGRYTRRFLSPEEEAQRTNEALAAAISAYIRQFDFSLKYYFSELEHLEEAEQELEREYRAFIQNGTII